MSRQREGGREKPGRMKSIGSGIPVKIQEVRVAGRSVGGEGGNGGEGRGSGS